VARALPPRRRSPADLIEPATVDRVDTPPGSAMRARRFLKGDTGHGTAVSTALTHGWHVPLFDADVQLTTATFDLGDFSLGEDDVDALAQVVRVDVPTLA
jgi:hypothetical protein